MPAQNTAALLDTYCRDAWQNIQRFRSLAALHKKRIDEIMSISSWASFRLTKRRISPWS